MSAGCYTRVEHVAFEQYSIIIVH